MRCCGGLALRPGFAGRGGARFGVRHGSALVLRIAVRRWVKLLTELERGPDIRSCKRGHTRKTAQAAPRIRNTGIAKAPCRFP